MRYYVRSKVFLVTGGLVAATVMSGVSLIGQTVRADDVVDDVTVTVPVSCSLNATNTAHSANLNPGQSASDIGQTTLNAFCNDSNGYAIYAIGFTDDQHGKTTLSSATLGSEHDIHTAKHTSSSTDSSWSMKLSTSGSSYVPTIRHDASYDYTNYEVVPSQYQLVASYGAGTDVGTGAVGSTINTTYFVYVKQTQASGTYVGKVKYTLVHPDNAAAPVVPNS